MSANSRRNSRGECARNVDERDYWLFRLVVERDVWVVHRSQACKIENSTSVITVTRSLVRPQALGGMPQLERLPNARASYPGSARALHLAPVHHSGGGSFFGIAMTWLCPLMLQ